MPKRVVFDCVIFAQALISDAGPSAACLELARSKKLSLVWIAYIVQEVRELPNKLEPKYGVTFERVEAFISDVARFSELIEDVPPKYANPFDPDDSPYIDLALAANANLMLFWGSVQQRYWAFSMNPAEYAKQVTCPALYMRGADDPWVTASEAQSLFNNLRGNKTLLTIPHAGNEGCYPRDKERWTLAVTEFLK